VHFTQDTLSGFIVSVLLVMRFVSLCEQNTYLTLCNKLHRGLSVDLALVCER